MKRFILPVSLFSLFLVCSTVSAQTLFWTTNSREAVLKGDSKGVAVDDTGRIFAAPGISGKYVTGEQFVWSAAADKSGNIFLGTGSNGRLFRVDGNGKGALLFDSEEINVSAVAVGADDSVYAATSPDGKVYKISPDGSSSVYFEPKTKYIWSLAVAADGGLFVGTGETGRIYKVSKAGETPAAALFYDSRETHIISLDTDSKGNLFAGTDSSGLVLRIAGDKKAFAILDSSLREIHEVSVGPDGSVYALALSESVSTKTPDPVDPNASPDNTVSVKVPDPAVPPAPPVPGKSRYDTSSSKSVVYRVLPDGTVDIIWNSEKVPAFSIVADPKGGGVFVGTSDRGRIFRISDTARESLLLQTEEEQISNLLASQNGIVATTSNKGNVFRFGNGRNAEGIYESPVLDAKSTAKWGRIWPESGGRVAIETRSGNSAKPGETWSDWNAPGANGSIQSPPARFLQWRARVSSDSTSSISEATVSFAALNIAPEVLSIEILPPNVGLAPNPEVVVDPNIKTLGLNPGDFGLAIAPVPPRRVFQAGARSIQWKASDRNKDTLVYRVLIKKAGDSKYRPIGGLLSEQFITLDGLSLEDGRYVAKVVAYDSKVDQTSSGLSGERVSEFFDIDNSPPKVAIEGAPSVTAGNVTVRFKANETSSYIKRAEYNVNGGRWYSLRPDDGIADGKSESYTVNAKVGDTGNFVIALRVFDAVGNIGTAQYAK
ncbi:MAG: hypothetical protein HKN33_05115 [Pyrinomonadaceae bacterium]|nr:hypothetical protein [Pyrinomonadaceae bacterium]